MNVISNKRLRDFAIAHPQADVPLQQWRKLLEKNSPKNTAELRKMFNTVDIVGDNYIFDIKGNHYRVICGIDFPTQRCFIRHVLTHPEYDRGKWK